MNQPYKGTPFDLSGRAVLISGATGLLGTEFALAAASAGADLILGDLDGNRLELLKNEIIASHPDVHVLIQVLDVTRADSCQSIAQLCEDRFGRIDGVVHSAAIDPKFEQGSDTSRFSKFTEFPLALWQTSLDVNLTGAFQLAQATCRIMEKSGRGSVVFLGSNYGLVGPDQRIYKKAGQEAQTYKPAVYSVCKAGLLGLTKFLAAYYMNTSIRTNLLTPSGVWNKHDSEFTGHYSSRTILGRMSEKEEYRGAILFLLSDASSYMTGANLVIDGGWTAL
ncbi:MULTISPECIES: SDR family oxidoreductase [Nitrosomonas]|uniref:Short-chain dehydrogenase/reductase (SDR) superfamily n=1 Tax=Nitrosomonas europaea (strain ATCC 19718 / CIP 103999 / KCTC 2705 / NBRC 14298) TaxID=228410 RepID=Q82UC5_NITEU|nr:MULTISPECIES: SDR family oxidoreductase [Nitrosomonas]CAD85478.1 Short-chain dehydrogenase/reductase (SDR) superfamily [Nitrosomonas europaea ATCC 19718]SDW82553.1 2-deoxy-D-gluconate 3-dehydrogenase [Nitrosomonas europaea]SET36557.1 2-deoxy-D-gluconate 3-dehydrogenase [Nitrosomonas europaea]SJZ91543.1 2-deoxy-D-gluconate 3-dehydrogenase [Nitrosomonas europaea]HBF25205.1 KR domain-containing protein [Nitrosomonas sp.]